MDCEIVRPEVTETTAFGAAALAGLAVGFWESKEELARTWKEEKRFTPQLSEEKRRQMRAAWDTAVEKAKS